MNKIDMLFILCLLGLYFLPKKSEKYKYYFIFPLVLFIITIGIRIQSKIEGHKNSEVINNLKSQIVTIEKDRIEKEQEIKELKKQTQNIEEDLSPRVISPTQITLMKNILTPLAGNTVEINVMPGNIESRKLAGQIKEIFITSGWHVGSIVVVGNAHYIGISMRVKGKDKYPSFAIKVKEALNVTGFDIQIYSDNRIGENDVKICIGDKNK